MCLSCDYHVVYLSLHSFSRPLLVILDRDIDLATPLHHTWTYQALVHDCFVSLSHPSFLHRSLHRSSLYLVIYLITGLLPQSSYSSQIQPW